VLKGTRDLNTREARSIANSLRKYYGKMFEPIPGNDRFHKNIIDGVRYASAEDQKKEVDHEIKKRKTSHQKESIKGPDMKKPGRLQEVYLLNKVKYRSTASETELEEDLTENVINEDWHRITAAKLRYLYRTILAVADFGCREF